MGNIRSLVVITALAMALVRIATSAAAVGPDCNWYDYHSDAQADLERTPEGVPTQLDPDGDGIACDELPSKPHTLLETQRIRGSFSDTAESPLVEGLGYSNRYTVHLALVTFEVPPELQSPCLGLTSSKTLFELLEIEGFARSFYVIPTDGSTLPPDEGGESFEFSGLVWTVFDDSASPMMLNEWLINQGLAFYSPSLVPSDTASRLADAQASAKSAQQGVWGECTAPEALASNTNEAPIGSIVFESSSGDQVVPFSIDNPATYKLTVDVSGGNVVFVAADVYTSTGVWIPEMSITTLESGQYSSAGFLNPGDYNIQIKSLGSWRVTLSML